MKIIRVLVRVMLAIALVSASAAAAYRLCWQRVECEIEKKTVDQRLREPGEYERQAVGVWAMARLRPCIERDPADWQCLVFMGRAAGMAGRTTTALTMFRSALALNERPEIYTNIAVIELTLRRPEQARLNMLRAAMFNATFAHGLSEPMRTQILMAASERRDRLRAQSENVVRDVTRPLRPR